MIESRKAGGPSVGNEGERERKKGPYDSLHRVLQQRVDREVDVAGKIGEISREINQKAFGYLPEGAQEDLNYSRLEYLTGTAYEYLQVEEKEEVKVDLDRWMTEKGYRYDTSDKSEMREIIFFQANRVLGYIPNESLGDEISLEKVEELCEPLINGRQDQYGDAIDSLSSYKSSLAESLKAEQDRMIKGAFDAREEKALELLPRHLKRRFESDGTEDQGSAKKRKPLN